MMTSTEAKRKYAKLVKDTFGEVYENHLEMQAKNDLAQHWPI